MNWPTGPPPMPSPGWYDDPDQSWTWRYWDGAYWTEHRAPMWVPPRRDPTSLSAWFERSAAAGRTAARRVGLLLLAVWLLVGASAWWLMIVALDGERGRELRRLLAIDRDAFGSTGWSVTADLTDAEAERAWELIQDISWSALPWLIVLTVVVVVVSAWSAALVAVAVRSHVVDPLGSDQRADGLGSVVAGAVRRVPAVLGSGIVVFAVYAVVWAVGSFPVVLVVLAGGGGAAVGLTAFFVVLLLLVVTVWLWGRLTLASVIAAVGGYGVGVHRSWDITHGRFWIVVGRLLLTGVVAGAAGGVVNAVNGFGQFLDVAVFLAIVFLSQGVAVAASIIVSTSGHLATIDQLDEQQLAGSSRGDGSA